MAVVLVCRCVVGEGLLVATGGAGDGALAFGRSAAELVEKIVGQLGLV